MAHRFDGMLEIRAGAIHLVDERQPRDVIFVGLPPNRFRLRLNAGHGVKNGDGAIEHVDVGEKLGDERGVVLGAKAAGERLLELGIFERSRPRASWASTTGSVVPATRASSMARADFENASDATEVSLTPAPCSTFSTRWMALVRSSDWALRGRVRSRRSRIARGWHEARADQACSTGWQIQAESIMSVLRPGTLCRC